MAERTSEIELSPLDQIRQTEGEVTRKIAAAREAAEQILENARQQAETLKRSAREAGTREGQGHYKTTIARAEEEARALVTEAGFQAERLRRRGQQRMKRGVSYAVNLVLGLAEEIEEK
ncbi:MAG TPA: V-type ATPase subunit subunit G family protein [Anaerolineales bacterium]